MGEVLGISMAIVSSMLGGMAVAVTRYLVVSADPITLAILRFGIGFLCVSPAAILMHGRWPERRDRLGVAGLGVMFFALTIVLYNVALGATTAARASLALSTLPFQTMLVGAFSGSATVLSEFGTREWIAGAYLAVGGGAFAFILWTLALQRASPTRVAITMTVNPMAAALMATVLVREPITKSFVVGLAAVFAGIWIAATEPKAASQ